MMVKIRFRSDEVEIWKHGKTYLVIVEYIKLLTLEIYEAHQTR